MRHGEVRRDRREVGSHAVEVRIVGQAADHHQRACIATLRGQSRHLRQRHPDIGEVDEADAVGHDADDRRGRGGVHRDLASQHVAACRVAALPDVARNDRHGFGARAIVGRREVATEHGLDAEHGERVGRHIQSVELLGCGTVAPQADGADRKGGRRAVEYPRVAAPILVVGKREAGLSAARIDRPHDRNAVRALERKVAPQVGIRADEGRVRHAHREREREDGAGRGPSVPGEDAPRKSQVCPDIGEGRRATDVAACLFDLVETARRQPDLTAHVGFRLSSADAVRDLALDVVAKLGVELALERLLPEQAAPPGHRDPPDGLRISSIASVNRSQLAASAFSCFRPLGVRR